MIVVDVTTIQIKISVVFMFEIVFFLKRFLSYSFRFLSFTVAFHDLGSGYFASIPNLFLSAAVIISTRENIRESSISIP